MNNLPYDNFFQAELALDGIEAIDYFLAKSLLAAPSEKLDNSGASDSALITAHNAPVTSLLFHLFLALSLSQRNGHSCLELNEIAEQTLWQVADDAENQQVVQAKIGYTFPSLETLLKTLQGYQVTGLDGDKQLLVLQYQLLYLRRYWQFEQQLAGFIADKFNESSTADHNTIEHILTTLFPSKNTNIDWQLTSVANALNKTFSIIAGGPGTGKTYTVTKLLAGLLMQNPSLNIAMVAPTGKAAQRLSESIINTINSFKQQNVVDEQILDKLPTTASTIHRLLGVIKNSPNFRHDQQHPLAIDVLLIDEVSMVDLAMMTRIFRAIPKGCKVILIGDADQLPSVATGSVLADLAPWPDSQYSVSNKSYLEQVSRQQLPYFNKQPSVDYLTYLTLSRRFKSDGGIGQLAKLVIAGDAENSWQLLTQKQNNELDFVANKTLQQYVGQLTAQYYQPIFKAQTVKDAFAALDKFRILVPTRVGEYGLENLNKLVEQHLIKAHCIKPKQELYHGRPIMISQNHYGVNLFNGDIGLLFKDNSGRLAAYFSEPGGFRAVSIARLPSFETVYAMTIHKTQGSEFENVALILPEQATNRLLSRELIYTAITRAKQHLQIFCKQPIWQSGVNKKVSRASGLSQRLLTMLS